MPREAGQRGGRKGGRGDGRGAGRVGKSFSNLKTLSKQLKDFKAAMTDAKNVTKLSPTKKKDLAEFRETKQVGFFKMPDASEPIKGKGRGKGKSHKNENTRMWIPCPLLPGVPAVPPPHIPQPWEIQRAKESHDITKEEKGEIIEGTPLCLITIPHADITDADEKTCLPLPESSTAVSETVPCARTPPRTIKRKLQFSPSLETSQSAVSTQNIVMAEIEFIGFTPSSSPTTAPYSESSAYEIDVNVDMERDLAEVDEGSDYENDDNLNDKNLGTHVDSESLEDPLLVEAMNNIDNAADLALRTALGHEQKQDLLHFDWRCDPENFKGVREVFTVPSTGPTFDTTAITPLGCFLKIWDTNIIAHIAQETNRYGHELLKRNQSPHSRLTRWKDVTNDEIRIFFAIMMLQSLVVNNVEREYWYPKIDELRIGNFGAIMPCNRFLAIKRCLHFVDNASLPVHPNRLDKIMPIIEHLNDKFSSLYVLEQNIAIDESLLLWKGRLTFSQKIATKKARVGIKSYELCESRTGYLWRMEVYSGKGHVHVAQVGAQEPVEEHEKRDEPQSATSQIVLSLMKPLMNKGYTLVMDNFYNAPLLSRVLKVLHKTDSMGTLRLCREFVPEALKTKSKTNMKTGEVAFSTTNDLSVIVWMDKNIVSMISTFHQVQVGGIEKYGTYRYKPQVILDYNLSMGGVDHKDQMLHAYPVERVRNIIWYKKLFRRLVNVSIHNAFVMFNHNRTRTIGNREFRLQLAHELLQMSRHGALPRPLVPPPPPPPSQMHLPKKNERPQRCKLCHAAKVRRTTMWKCSTCDVNLCIEGCYTAYHNKEEE